MPVGFMLRLSMLKRAPARDQLDYENNKSNDKQQVDESAQGIRSDPSEQPQNEQDKKNSPKHRKFSG